jgi:uncharacterized membrane protein
MRRTVGWVGKVVLLAACGGYQVIVHLAVNSEQAEPVRTALILLPLIALACWIATRSRHKSLWLLVLLVAGAAVYLLEHHERLGLAAASGIPHVAAYLFLLWFFGRTLLPGNEPLVTRLARRLHGTLSPQIEAYTRQVTLAWSLFFAAQVLASALLFAFASINTWSLFINLLNFPLLALVFVAEYVYRVRRYRDHPRVSISKVIQVFAQDFSLAKTETP